LLGAKRTSKRPVATSDFDPYVCDISVDLISKHYGTSYWHGLLGFDLGRPYQVAPLFGFVGDELAKFGRRAWKRRAAELGEPRLDLRIGEAGVNFPLEPVDDFRGRVFRSADAIKGARPCGRSRKACSPGNSATRKRMYSPDTDETER
jgi:hypothetical protein